jgi:hypothetical protein
MQGVAAYLEGRWRDALISCETAEATFRDHCTGAYWELDAAQTFRLYSRTYLGLVKGLALLCSTYLKEALNRGNRQSLGNIYSLVRPLVRMAADEVSQGEDELHAFARELPRAVFHVQHCNSLYRFAVLALYRGDSRTAWVHMSKLAVEVGRSLLNRVQHLRRGTFELRARCCLAMAQTGKNSIRHRQLAERDAHRLDHENRPDARALATLIRAGVAMVRSNLDGAILCLQEAPQQFEACDMGLHAAVARRRLGQLLGGDQGRKLINQADAWMTAQDVRNPVRMAAVLAPGFRD